MVTALIFVLIGADTILGNVTASQINRYLLYSSVAIFLCIPPLLQVEDTLPKEILEERKMKKYLENARRLIKKE